MNRLVQTNLLKFVYILLSLFCFCSSAKLKQEFIRGFETGILLREDNRAFKDYSCARPELEEESLLTRANQVVAPMKLMSAMMKEEKLDKTVKQLDLFIKGMSDMTGVFAAEYDEGDFCKGLVFGKEGAQMLYNLAMQFVEEEEEEEEQQFEMEMELEVGENDKNNRRRQAEEKLRKEYSRSEQKRSNRKKRLTFLNDD